MPGSILAIVTPDNTPGGSILTFAFPVGLFVVVAVLLYLLLFSRPHARVPARLGPGPAHAGPPGPEAARAAAAAGGLPVAAGGGTAESAAEPAAAAREAVGHAGTSNLSDQGGGRADAADPPGGTSASDGTEASE